MFDIFSFDEFLQGVWVRKLAVIMLYIVSGFLLNRLLIAIIIRTVLAKANNQTLFMVKKIIHYSFFFLVSVLVLYEFGIRLSAILGAAGVIGIVVGIASQTSFGNIVSGIFLVSEKAFEIGEIIKVGETMGVVYGIDLLSVKIKTFDNLIVRIPHQHLISNEFTNITRMPIRRLNIDLSVAYKEDLDQVETMLRDIAANNTLVLTDPEPIILFKAFGSSGIEIFFGVWFEKSNFIKVKNSIFKEIKQGFDQAGIEIPFPHVSLYAGSASSPISVNLENKDKK